MTTTVALYRGALDAEMAWIEPAIDSRGIAHFYTVFGVGVLGLPHGPRYFGVGELVDLAPVIFADWRPDFTTCCPPNLTAGWRRNPVLATRAPVAP